MHSTYRVYIVETFLLGIAFLRGFLQDRVKNPTSNLLFELGFILFESASLSVLYVRFMRFFDTILHCDKFMYHNHVIVFSKHDRILKPWYN